ncbi:MAG: TolC family protein [Prevotella sp.]|nr:TolC family protein [Prevotella sp.]MBQ3745763.1 TolC family protein [Prevotella sp.]MBR0165574.1 TolC family protein [Prevotella sp.]
MKRLSNIFIVAAVSLMLTGCGLYNKYEKTVEESPDVFGNDQSIKAAMGETSIAEVSWREFFTDPLLQQLIEQALANNTDMATARINVEKSEIALKARKLAYLPSLYFSPQGALSSFDGAKATKSYTLPLDVSWDIDVFGSNTNKKRAAKAVLLQSQMAEESTRSNLISAIARQYSYLQLLDRELDILLETDSLWKVSLDTQQALYENGKTFSTAVNQQESSWLSVKLQIVSIRRSIRSVENDICSLLCITPQHIERSHWSADEEYYLATTEGQRLFEERYMKIGVPAMMLERRPDIRLANYYMEEAFYNTQAARAAFYPSITLTGEAGWTNNGGLVNPSKLLWQLVGSLTQPIFARGQINANYKISKLTEENLKKKYVQAIVDAGNQVNQAIADCQAARENHAYYHRQVEVLHEAYFGTHELMDNGKATYLEVLTAQESLLSAQLNEATNMYDATQATISLYIALGGGTK